MACVFFDKSINKMVPCTIVPNEIYKINVIKDPYVRVVFDNTKFAEFNVTIEELRRYSFELVPLIDIYPNTNETELTYASSGNYDSENELNRFKVLIDMLTNVDKLVSHVFYSLAEFISYELLFRYLTVNERIFMASLSAMIIEENELDPEQDLEHANTNMILMTKRIFDKYPNVPNDHKIINYKHFGTLSHITFPIILNITNLKTNIYTIATIIT